jgi:hypothetical protein
MSWSARTFTVSVNAVSLADIVRLERVPLLSIAGTPSR